MSNDILSVELEVSGDKADVVISRTKQRLEDFVKTAQSASPDLAGKLTTDFDTLSKRVEQTRQKFADIAKVRIDGGQIGNLSREILTAQTHSRQLAGDIAQIKKELANPNRTTSITFLTASLRAAEEEADRLTRKLNSLPSGASGSGGKGALKLSGFQKTNLSFQVNDVLTGLASGQNPSQILAQQGGQIAQIFSPAQITAFTAAYGGLVSILGAGTLAIAATYKITGDLRTEAERYLKVQELIVGATNRQILSQKQGLIDLQKAREEASGDRRFNQLLGANSVEDLQRQKANLEQLKNLVPATLPALENGKIVSKANADFTKISQQLLAIDAQIEATRQSNQRTQNDAFNERNEAFKKSQLDSIEFEKKRAEAEKKRLENVEQGKAKVRELEKTYLDTFSNLAAKLNSNNPFVSVFTEADKALRDLRTNLRGLPPELQKAALEMQRKINFRQLLEAQTNNQLSAFDLREQASQFRNPFDSDAQKKNQDEFVKNFLQRNPNYLFTQGKNSVDEETRSKILKQFAPSALNETPADRLNKSLEEKFNLLYKPGQTSEQQAISDKRFISLTAGANPLDLSKSLRESAALVREREAIRQERYQQDALAIYRQQLEAQNKIADNTARQNKIAEKGGGKAIDVLIKDERASGTATLQKSATAQDTQAAYYDPNLDFNSGGFSNR